KLLQPFADQAVIAIENVRLFQELQARTRELVRSVEEMKALGEVGQAVSSTLELETVLTTIVSHAVQLSGTNAGIIYEYDEPTQLFHLGPAIRWRKSWSRPIGRPQADSELELVGERPQRGCQCRSSISSMSESTLRLQHAPSWRGLAINLSSPYRFFWNNASWGP